ncbi:MAG: RcnB family protein [Rhizomicrobium sp.]|jgi:Ni/Co efflux regulator RcnB
MKNLLISAFALCLATAVPSVLLAADDNKDQGASHGSMAGPSDQHAAPTKGPSGGFGATDHHTTTGSTGTTHRTYHRTTPHSTTAIRHTSPHAVVDVSSFRKNITSPNHYHYGDYHGPAGYSYHRWNSGDHLPQAYYAENFWINNYLNFGLIAPPDGYVWVRYGPDAVLIDEDTGEIIQVEYDVFY